MDKLISVLLVTRLKDLIKSIRSCKTAAEERQVIARESAFIRTAFKEENTETRYINVQKLLYIYMLGYPAHFGQIECLKLVASPRFVDKKLGYLGTMLLLDENQEVLTLVTNSLKNDLNNSNMYIVGIALCTLGNIASTEMSRDLCGEVEKLLGSSNAFVRKKAALCALRIIKKVPDLMENFIAKATSLLNERNHSVLMTGTTLLIEMCKMDPSVLQTVRGSVPALVRHLKNLVTAGFSPEHDVSGITDPFLQVKILRLMRVLGKGDAQASEVMNDVLAQVATNTEASKNVGNAILYETVLTILDTESENSLRVMAVNILGKFLSNRDNNIRYVALTTLTKTAQETQAADASALQRHRAIILECLRDPDITIRRVALDLSFFLINSTNIRILTRELLSFLEVAESDIKSSTATRICDFAGRHRPNKRWEVDTVIRVLRVAGAHVDQATVNHAVKLVSTCDPELQQYAVRKLWAVCKTEGDRALIQEGLVQAMGWCVGEYGDVLVSGGGLGAAFEDEGDVGVSSPTQAPPTEKEVVEMFDTILRGPYATKDVKEYLMTALVKLLGRFQQQPVLEFIRQIIGKYKRNQDVEIQARATEFTALSQLDAETRVALLERMPVLEAALKEEALKGTGQGVAADASASVSPEVATRSVVNDLASDLLGLSVGSSAATASTPADDLLGMLGGGSRPSAAPASSKTDNIMDLLGGIGLGTAAAAPVTSSFSSLNTVSPIVASKPTAANDLLGDLFGSAPAASPVVSEAVRRTYPFYNKNGLKITFTAEREQNGTVMNVSTLFQNVLGSGTISNLLFQVAVPKSVKLIWSPATSDNIPYGGTASQNIRIENQAKAPVRFRLKISFIANGQNFDEITDFGGFDPVLWS